MRFTAQEEYGLRCMVHVARHAAEHPVTIQEIARAERLTTAYVAKLLRILRRGRLVESRHGPAGGYRLPRRPESISVAEILEVLDGRLFRQKFCERYPGGHSACVHTSACSIRTLWAGLDLIMESILSRTSLLDLANMNRALPEWIRSQGGLAGQQASAPRLRSQRGTT